MDFKPTVLKVNFDAIPTEEEDADWQPIFRMEINCTIKDDKGKEHFFEVEPQPQDNDDVWHSTKRFIGELRWGNMVGVYSFKKMMGKTLFHTGFIPPSELHNPSKRNMTSLTLTPLTYNTKIKYNEKTNENRS